MDGTENTTEPQTDGNGEIITPSEEPDEEVISYDGGLGLPEDGGSAMVIDPMPEDVTNVAAPGPGETEPGE